MNYDGGPAFPSEMEFAGNLDNQHTGMSLRDWFAGQALTSLASVDRDVERFGVEDVAMECYQLADAMIAQRGMENSHPPVNGLN